ncbi:MAG: hypothetical protein HKN87_18865 [Saprospiraceae bacterium]|nr:hypothetical protein [Saprospiraceae bacterium]
MNSRLISVLILCLFTACYYDIEEELVDAPECNELNIGFAQEILPIIQNRCYKCHSSNLNLGNVTLQGYTALKQYVDNGRLWGAINHDPGFSPMPQNEMMLPECEIKMIGTWISDGAKNN